MIQTSEKLQKITNGSLVQPTESQPNTYRLGLLEPCHRSHAANQRSSADARRRPAAVTCRVTARATPSPRRTAVSNGPAASPNRPLRCLTLQPRTQRRPARHAQVASRPGDVSATASSRRNSHHGRPARPRSWSTIELIAPAAPSMLRPVAPTSTSTAAIHSRSSGSVSSLGASRKRWSRKATKAWQWRPEPGSQLERKERPGGFLMRSGSSL